MSEHSPLTAERSPQDRRSQLKSLLRKKLEKSRSFPLSFAQQRLWILEQLDPANPVYNIPLAIRLKGPLDQQALNATLDEVVSRHESLRTRFVLRDEDPIQIVDPHAQQKLTFVDLQDVNPESREAAAMSHALEEARCPFRLDQAPLLRVTLIQLAPNDHLLVVVMHHIISDGWSMVVLLREVMGLYEAFHAGRPSPLKSLPIQYADYAVWQRQRLQNETLQSLVDYWSRRLHDVPTLNLPTDRPRSIEARQAGATETVRLPLSLSNQLRETARREGATPYMLLLAAFDVLLGRYSGQDDFAVGSPIAGRIGKETEGVVGFFVNSLAMRVNLADDPQFLSLLGQVRQSTLEAFQYQELPFEKLVDALNPERSATSHPVFQVSFSLENSPWPEVDIAGLQVSVVPLDSGTSKFDLSFTARELKDGLEVSAEYSTSLFDRGAIQRMLRHYECLLESIAADPELPISRLSMLSEEERGQVLVEWNGAARATLPSRQVIDLFAEQVERSPDGLALIDGPRHLSYRELDERSNRIAHCLQSRGVGRESIVAIRLHRSAELIATIWGVLKAGGAYLPLDPYMPAERLKLIIEDARANVVVTEGGLLDELPPGIEHVLCVDTDAEEIGRCSSDRLAARPTPEDLAYIIYTSGSTGRPKGVMIEHRALAHFVSSAADLYAITAADRMLQFASASFDAHVEEVFVCLTHGGTLILRDDDMLDARTFLDRCEKSGLTFTSLPTGFWHELVAAMASENLSLPASVRVMVIGGERALPERVATWFRHSGSRARLINSYGPSETTVAATAADLNSAHGLRKFVPIGRPMANMWAYVLDQHGQPAPVEVPGELHIAGECLARGYLNQPELTRDRFVTDPFSTTPTARMYKTGDVVRWNGDGQIEFIGRTDHQVKIRGFRVEPGEIEKVLRDHSALSDVVVVVRERAAHDLQLVAYVVPKSESTVEATELRHYLRQYLPEYMVPAEIVTLESIPLTSGGKVDRRALPTPVWTGIASAEDQFIAPRTETEGQLAAIWRELLNVERVGAHDNFFDVGGNSLLGMRLVSRVRKTFSVNVPLRSLFVSPTLSALAGVVESSQMTQRLADLPPISIADRAKPLPLSHGQEALWVISQLMEGRSPYVTFPVARVRGALNISAVESALNEVVRRHESLRTTFEERDGQPVQVIAPFAARPLRVVDLSGLPVEEREVQVQRYAASESERPIDLTKGPLLRVDLLKLAADEHVLLVGMHHIIFDGWSLEVLNRELLVAYAAFSAGRSPSFPALPIQYADYAAWQRERLQGSVLEGLRRYWLKKLESLPTLELPTDRPRPAVRTTNAAVFERQLPLPLSQAAEELSRAERVTPFMTFAATFQILLKRYSGQEDFPIGTLVAGRLHPETEGLIGYFVNTLVMRANLSGDPSFGELLGRVKETALEAFDHQEMPFERLVQELNPPRDLSRHPVFQAMFVFQNTPDAEKELVGLESGIELNTQDVQRREIANDLDLIFLVSRNERGFQLAVQYNTDLFDEATVDRLLGHFQTLLEGIVADRTMPVSRLPLLTAPERVQILDDWNGNVRDFGRSETLQQLFEEQVERTPQGVAVEFEGRTLSYHELNERANQLAHRLIRQGVGPDIAVGVCLERSLEMPVSLLAILKAGGAYLPLDPDYPADRLAIMIEDSQPAAILSVRSLTEHLPADASSVLLLDEEADSLTSEPASNPELRNDPLDVSYILYTSGSTGKPKGVRNNHRGICNFILCLQDRHSLTTEDRYLQKTPYSFDMSVYEFFWTLTTGARLVMARPGGQKDPGYLVDVIAECQITSITFVPSMLSIFLQEEDVERCRSLRRVICGGETLSYELQRQFYSRLNAELHNIYGPTEAAIAVTFWTCRENAAQLVPLGKTIPNIQCLVLDPARNLQPIGVPGELYLGGVGLARDYLNRPELTAEKFVPHPFSPDASARLYRTGDLCRYLPDGNILFLGRIDTQVKIRGHRIELGEIQAGVLKHPGVRDAVVNAIDNGSGGKELALYWVARETSPTVNELREFLLSALPDYMVPTAFVQLEKIPVNANGKADVKALPTPSRQRDERNEFIAPRTPVEVLLTGLWSEVLHVERVGVHDNFFELGGHSLAAIAMLSRIKRECGVNIPLREVFASPTVAELAVRILDLQSAPPVPEVPPISPIDHGAPLPVSYGQEAMWVISQLMEGGSPYVTFPVARVRGTLKREALEQALNEVVRRHASLRTTFHEIDGRPMQVISPFTERPLKVIDLSGLPADQREAEVQRYALAESQKPINLETGPLARVELLKLSADEHVLLVGLHHIIYDGWSLSILNRELLAAYAAFATGRPSPLPALPIQYADFAVWQRQRLQGPVLERLDDYWLKQLHDLPTLELPTDRPRPAVRTINGAVGETQLSRALSVAIEDLSRQERATPFMTLAAAVQALLQRYSGQEDFPIGTAVAGRLHPETEALIGYFVNTLVLRANLSGDPSFRELLGRVRQTSLDAFENQEMPFERLVHELNPPRDLSRHPLFQVMFVLQNTPDAANPFVGGMETGLELNPQEIQRRELGEDFDLTFVVTRNDRGFHVSLGYNTDLFEEATIRRMLGHFQTLLEGIVADSSAPLSRLPLLTEAERQQILVEWNDTALDFGPDECLQQLVESQVKRTPDAVAVEYEGRQLTYRELNAWSNQIAHRLVRSGVGPDVTVGVCLERSCEMIVSLLAVLKAGGAYLPLDPEYPAERLALMIRDSQPAAVLTRRSLAGGLPADESPVICLDEEADAISREPSDNPPFRNRPEDISYVIYTSGSTGVPKGSRNTHRGLCNFLWCMQNEHSLQPDDRVLQKNPFTFDISIIDLFWPLIVGARVVMARPGGHRDPRYLLETIVDCQITTTMFVPSMLSVFLQEEGVERCQSLRRVIVGGEALSYELQRQFSSRLGPKLHNLYGPTEAAVAVTFWKCRENPEELVPLGKPIPNTECYILDSRRNPVPVGVPGELYLGGVGLARDYLNRPELTAEKFVSHPFSSDPGFRLYRTGDLCRYLPDGHILYLGRLDHQVKIRGFRIELGEIQAALLKHPAVKEAVVTAFADGSGGKELAAYWVAGEAAATVSELREFLLSTLPDYMVPNTFVPLERIPVNANGKVDLKSLPTPTRQRDDRHEFVAPRTPIEEQVARIWCEVLRVDRVGMRDNFFELGGHSLFAIAMVSRIKREFNVSIPLREVFAAPTAAALCARIEQLQSAPVPLVPAITHLEPSRARPLSYGQEALWVINQLMEGQSPYVTFPVGRVRGNLNVPALERALNEVLRRHESLRTTFQEVDGSPVQLVTPFAPQRLNVVDLSKLPSDEREVEVQRYALSESQRPIDLAKGPLARVELLKLSTDEHVLLVGMHHIIYDGWSLGILNRELITAYVAFVAGHPMPLPELPIQYADYAVWQRQRLQGEVLEGLRGYWLKQLEGLPTLDLPTDRPRPAVRTINAAALDSQLSLPLTEQLEGLSRQNQATPFMTLAAAFQTLLHRYSGQSDFPIGTAVAGRLHPDTEGLIGYFVNTLVLRSNLAGDPSFRELLGRVRESSLAAFEHQEMPFEQLVQDLNPPRDPSRHPVFQVMFVLQNTPDAGEPFLGGDSSLELNDLESQQKELANDFDLSLIVTRKKDGFQVALKYNTDLFDEATISRMQGHFLTLLEGIVADIETPISKLPLLTERERQQMLVEWNDTRRDFGNVHCLQQLVEAQVERTPDAIAVEYEDQQLTYRELNARANQVAHCLIRLGIGPDVSVGVCLERSCEMVISLLAVLKAGGAYLPLDPDYPTERLALMVRDSRPGAIVSTTAYTEKFPAGESSVLLLDDDAEKIESESTANPSFRNSPSDIAYIIYTSGSTGVPKGARNTHRGICNYIFCLQNYRPITADDRFLQKTPFSFDVSVHEFFWPLMAGARIVVARPGGHKDSRYLIDLIEKRRVTSVDFVPSMLGVFLQEEGVERCQSLKRVLCGGETLPHETVQRFFSRLDCELHNTYGPTEAAVAITLWNCEKDSPIVPLGRPIPNTECYILDSRLNPLPIGVPGELYLGGVGLGRDYLNRPELTAEKFIPHPFSSDPGARLYQTGDLCRYLPDGNLMFLGRLDHQVKIRGHRIELGEIRTTLQKHPAIQDAVVTTIDDGSGVKELAAYWVARDAAPSVSELREFLLQTLPDYMVPTAFVLLDKIPVNANGKTDLKALPAPSRHRDERNEYIAPRTPVEELLAKLWCEVLEIDRVGVHDNFFDLGGHSLLALRVTSKARSMLGPRLQVAALFAAPTIAGLAERIESERGGESHAGADETFLEEFARNLLQPASGTGKSLVPLKTAASHTAAPLFCIHGLGGHVTSFMPLALGLGNERSVYGLMSQGLEAGQRPHDRIEDMAAWYLNEIRAVQPRGPYLLAGWSMGGMIALEVAQQLTSSGEEVSLVALLDAYIHSSDMDEFEFDEQSLMRKILPYLNLAENDLQGMSEEQKWQRIAEQAELPSDIGGADIRRLAETCRAHETAFISHQPRKYSGNVVLFPAEAGTSAFDSRWKQVCPNLRIEGVPGNHYSMLRKPNVGKLIAALRAAITDAEVPSEIARVQ